jgi:hypothetical protein
MNYDPNMIACGRTAKQTVHLVFGLWEYRKAIDVIVNSNLTGFDVIDAAVCVAFDSLDTDIRGNARIIMKKGEREDLDCVDDEDEGDEWLRCMLISAEILSISNA